MSNDVTVFYESAAVIHVGISNHERISTVELCRPGVVVHVCVDGGLQYEKVVWVLKILHDANITKMALVTQPEDQPVKK